jgi:hypothetical protein
MTSDIVQFRKLILGILDTIPGNTSWRFLDPTYVFPDTLNPFSNVFPEKILFNNLNSNRFNSHFKAIKIGDVNESADPANARTENDSIELKLLIDEKSGEMTLVMEDYQNLEGFQFELNFDNTQFEIEAIEYPNEEVLDHSNVSLGNGHLLRVSWNSQGGSRLKSAELVKLKARDGKISALHSAVKIRSKELAPEAYFVDNESIASIKIQVPAAKGNTESEVLSCFPNPSSGPFQVKIPGPESFSHLRLLDITGRVVWEKSGQYIGQFTIPDVAMNPGLFLLELSNESQKIYGKIQRL